MATIPGSQNDGRDFETLFAELLHPIRDLDKNWAVDLSNHLQQYLEQFVLTTDTPMEFRQLNFAQAAMLLQGSAHIYSKKVQFIYNKTFELYEMLINRKKSKQHDASQENADREGDEVTSMVDQFLTLDDLPVSHSVNRSNQGRRSVVESIRTPIPNLLMQQNDTEKPNFMLVNTKGIQLGNRNDTSLFRFLVGSTGSLLSCGSEIDLISERPATAADPAPQEPPADEMNIDQAQDLETSVFDNGPGSPVPFIPLEEPQSTEKRARQSRANMELPHEIAMNVQIDHDKEDTLVVQPVDAHQDTKSSQNPRKETKVHRHPKALRKKRNPKRSSGNEEKENERHSNGIGDVVSFTIEPFHDICYSNVSKFPKNSQKVPNSADFYHQYWQKHKQDRKMLIEMNRKRRSLSMTEIDDEQDLEIGDGDHLPLNDVGDPDYLSDDEAARGLNLQDLPINQRENENHNFDALLESQAAPAITTYEELARNQIAKFHESNAKFQRGSDMTKRVAEWEERIQPLLDSEESRRPYDIHAYGSEILECFEDNNRKQTLPFTKIMEGKAVSEIPRYFLSSLLLANCYNVELSANGVLEEGMDTLELTLLSRRRHHEGLEEFRATAGSS